MSKQFNTEFRKKGKQDLLGIVLSCTMAYCRDIQKKLIFSKLVKIWLNKQEENEEQEIKKCQNIFNWYKY